VTLSISLFVIALGAILKFAIRTHLAGIDIGTVGVILMIAGGAGLLIALGLVLAGGESAERAE
jgi:hypothetical protein